MPKPVVSSMPDTQVVPDPMLEKRTRRQFSTEYKLRIIAQAWLMLGDNAYSDGTDAEYQDAVFDMYPSLLRQTVVWPTLGNHDGHSADSDTLTGPYYGIFTLPKSGVAGG